MSLIAVVIELMPISVHRNLKSKPFETATLGSGWSAIAEGQLSIPNLPLRPRIAGAMSGPSSNDALAVFCSCSHLCGYAMQRRNEACGRTQFLDVVSRSNP